jgi:hypothetical protein
MVQDMEISAEALTESMLVSAYDIFYKHLLSPVRSEFVPQVAFLDSGGYEVAEEHDDSAVFKFPSSMLEWDEAKLISVINSWPERVPLVVINYDYGATSIKKQIDAARKLFAQYPQHAHDMLLKPTTRRKQESYIDASDVLGRIEELKEFPIIGFTEKELGDSLLDRVLNIARIRIALDNVPSDSNTMLHIFGSLDPLTSCLYFLAGAEIFDGLTWLRYAYQDGVAVYQSNFGALRLGIQEAQKVVRGEVLIENINYLTRLKYQMINYARTGDFGHFEHNAASLRDWDMVLHSQLGGLM